MHPPPRLTYVLTLMKPRSLNLDHADEREGACTRRRSDVSPTANETARRPGGVTRRSKFLRLSPSPSPVSSFTIQGLYPHFLKLFRHPFGKKQSPFRQQSQAWLSSLGNNHVQYLLLWFGSNHSPPLKKNIDLRQLLANAMEMRYPRTALPSLC